MRLHSSEMADMCVENGLQWHKSGPRDRGLEVTVLLQTGGDMAWNRAVSVDRDKVQIMLTGLVIDCRGQRGVSKMTLRFLM